MNLSSYIKSNSTATRTAKNLLAAFGSGVIGRLFTIIGTAYLARILGAEKLGKIGFVEGVFTFVILLSDVGLQTIGTREVARNRHNPSAITNLVNSIISIQFILVSFWYFCLILTTWLFLAKDMETKWLLIVYGVCVLYSFLPTLEWWLNGIEQLQTTAVLRVIREIMFLGIILVFVKSSKDVFFVPIAVGVSTFLVACYICFLYLKTTNNKLWFYYNGLYWINLLKQAWPVGFVGLLNQVSTRSGVILLGFLSSNDEVGIFTAAWKLFYIGLEVLSVISTAVFPVMARLYISNQQSFEKAQSTYRATTFVVAIITLLGVAFFSSPIINLIFGSEYVASISVFQLLGSGLAFVFVSTSFSTSLLVSQDESALIASSILGVCTNLLLGIALVPKYGAIGAAWAYMLSTLCITIALILAYSRKIHLKKSIS